MDMVKYLVFKGAIVNTTDPDGRTPLYLASDLGRAEIVQFLTDFGANVNLQAKDGTTAIHAAAWAGALGVVQHLLNKQSAVNTANNAGEDTTPHRSIIWPSRSSRVSLTKRCRREHSQSTRIDSSSLCSTKWGFA